MIEVEGLTKYYGKFKALDDVSFHVERGEVVGFLGPNGAGKTTTMRILTGYMPPSAGRVSIGGHDVFDDSLAVRQRLGYLPETVPLYEEMTLWDYVSFMAELHHVPEREDRVAEVIELIDLMDRADSLISSLSKGMRQRVGLAQALVHQPDVLILDEPTIGLDPRQIREVRDLIRDIGHARTVLLSTHILPEVSQLCTRVLIIHQGKIVAEDTPENLSEHLQGSSRFLVRADGHPGLETVAQALLKVEGVTSAEVTEQGVEVASAQDVDPRPGVAKTVFDNSWNLLELRAVDLPLEEIFLQLTAEAENDEEQEEEAN
jgi:ABC-2 type transport system ATP-binding protein